MLISNSDDISAQKNQTAQLFMTNSQLLLGDIISTKNEIVKFKYFLNSTKNRTRLIPFEEVRRLISPDGTVIIENGYFTPAYIESTAFKSRAKEEWVIIGSEGIILTGVIPIIVKDDSLIFYQQGARVGINIEDIEEVSVRRDVSVLKWTLLGPLIGFVAGALISVVVDANSSCIEGKDVCFSSAVLFVPLGVILGPVIGYRFGKYRDRDTILDLRDLSHAEKKNILKNEFGFYTSNTS